MSINYKEIMKVLADLCEQEHIMVTLNGSMNSAFMAAACAGAGGLLGGTEGAALGS